jgi:predicted small integral membrane protein
MLIYFYFLYIFYPEKKRDKNLLTLTRILGFSSGFAIIMVAIYSEDYWMEHVFWSAIVFFLLFLINVSGGLFFLVHPDSIKKIGFFNLTVAAFHISYIFILDPTYIILEWINLVLGHCSMALAVYNYKQMYDEKS